MFKTRWMSELGERHVARMQERLDEFERGRLTLRQLIADLEALLGLLLGEADPNWIGELETECNRLEFVHVASLNDQRNLTKEENAEVCDTVQQLQLMLTRY